MVDGTKLFLEVAPEEESLYRQAATAYNKRVSRYRAEYPGDDEKARLMAGVEGALLLESCRRQLDSQPMEHHLEQLSAQLKDFLLERQKTS